MQIQKDKKGARFLRQYSVYTKVGTFLLSKRVSPKVDVAGTLARGSLYTSTDEP